jgi:hypothetical protein
MATPKRYPFPRPRGAGPSGEVWTASLDDRRPAVVLCGLAEPGTPGLAASVAARLARAGFTAVALDASGDEAASAGAHLVAVCDALTRGQLVSGLEPPAKLVVLGYDDGVEPARAYGARHRAEFLVMWRPKAAAGNREGVVEAEMIASGSHVVERSPQLGEALDGMLAWLARVM